jgi:hypothetical protein
LNGREYVIAQAEAIDRLAGVEPEPVRDHYVVVRGRRFPPKQELAALLGIDRADFTTHQARRILHRLGFETGRRRSETVALGVAVAPGVVKVSSVGSAVRDHGGLAKGVTPLRDFMGMWVAVRGDDVLASGASPREVLDLLERRDLTAESMFRVPLDPTRDVLGG